jgi:HAD superfamily hydrolase (TIGR01509 family)
MAAEAPGNIVLPLLDRLGLDALVFRFAELLSRRMAAGATPAVHAPVPGVPALLAHLHGQFPMAVVTNRRKEHAESFLTRHGLAPYFACVVGAEARTLGKPHPDMLLHAAAALGAPIDRCIMIGDTPVDMRAGRTAGAQTIGVLCGFGEEPELRRAGADLILPSTADVASLFLA